MTESQIQEALNASRQWQEKTSFDMLAELEKRMRSLVERDTPKEAVLTDESKIDIKLPVIRISEAWGRTGNADREIIENFAKNISGNTLEQKLASLNSVLSGENAGTNVSELLSTMMICEILSSILRDFTESAGGFIFEGFLAGLFGGKSVQITKPEDIEGMAASGKPITDVVLNDKHYSLKLLGETTGVKGSFANMVKHFESVDHVIYLDARRVEKDQGLEFGEFTITLPGFLDVFVTPFLEEVWKKEKDAPIKDAAKFKEVLASLYKQNMGIKEIRFGKPGILPKEEKEYIFKFSPKAGGDWDEPDAINEEVKYHGAGLKRFIEHILAMDTAQLQEFGGDKGFSIHYAERKFEGTKAEKLFGSMAIVQQVQRAIASGDKGAIIASLRKTDGFINKQQFEFTRKQAEEIGNFTVVGTLMIGEKHMKSVWTAYASMLQEVINPVYGNLQEFTNNINAYLLGAGDTDRKQRGDQAIRDAQQLKESADKAVKTVTPDK